MKKTNLISIIAIIIIIGLIAFFYPKDAGGGTCGMCGPGQYKWEEYNCLGFDYVISGCSMHITDHLFGKIGQCTDAPTQLLCYGLVYGSEKCYDKSDEPRTLISCD